VLETIFGALAGSFFRELFSTLLSAFQRNQENAAREELGATRVSATRNQEAADAERRASAVPVSDVGTLIADAKDGNF
jgi:predicted lipid-binding transport protein (Tim44 family)